MYKAVCQSRREMKIAYCLLLIMPGEHPFPSSHSPFSSLSSCFLALPLLSSPQRPASVAGLPLGSEEGTQHCPRNEFNVPLVLCIWSSRAHKKLDIKALRALLSGCQGLHVLWDMILNFWPTLWETSQTGIKWHWKLNYFLLDFCDIEALKSIFWVVFESRYLFFLKGQLPT